MRIIPRDFVCLCVFLAVRHCSSNFHLQMCLRIAWLLLCALCYIINALHLILTYTIWIGHITILMSHCLKWLAQGVAYSLLMSFFLVISWKFHSFMINKSIISCSKIFNHFQFVSFAVLTDWKWSTFYKCSVFSKPTISTRSLHVFHPSNSKIPPYIPSSFCWACVLEWLISHHHRSAGHWTLNPNYKCTDSINHAHFHLWNLC